MHDAIVARQSGEQRAQRRDGLTIPDALDEGGGFRRMAFERVLAEADSLDARRRQPWIDRPRRREDDRPMPGLFQSYGAVEHDARHAA